MSPDNDLKLHLANSNIIFKLNIVFTKRELYKATSRSYYSHDFRSKCTAGNKYRTIRKYNDSIPYIFE